MKSDSMNERATKLLRMAEGMDERIQRLYEMIEHLIADPVVVSLINDLDTCKRASRRLWAAYINELTKIKLGI